MSSQRFVEELAAAYAPFVGETAKAIPGSAGIVCFQHLFHFARPCFRSLIFAWRMASGSGLFVKGQVSSQLHLTCEGSGIRDMGSAVSQRATRWSGACFSSRVETGTNTNCQDCDEQVQIVNELVMEFLKRVLPKFEAAKAFRGSRGCFGILSPSLNAPAPS